MTYEKLLLPKKETVKKRLIIIPDKKILKENTKLPQTDVNLVIYRLRRIDEI